MQEQPFYIGQKVVFLKDGDHSYKKGVVYIVKEILQCPKCSSWIVGALEHGIDLRMCYSTCTNCNNHKYEVSAYWRRSATHFATIHEGFEYISFTKVLEEELVLVSVN